MTKSTMLKERAYLFLDVGVNRRFVCVASFITGRPVDCIQEQILSVDPDVNGAWHNTPNYPERFQPEG